MKNKLGLGLLLGFMSAVALAAYVPYSVTSGENKMRIEYVMVTASCTSTPCTIASQSGSWVTSVSRVSTGIYRLNIASGIFSVIPTCNVMAENLHVAVNNPQSTVLLEFASYNASHSLSDVGRMNIICMGPR